VTEAEPADPILAAAQQRLAETQRIVRELGEAMSRIDRERRRVRPEDWDTLLRQIQTLFVELGTHPFLAGDAHAEMLLARMGAASDLEEFDRRVTDLGQYVAGKLAYNAALRALREGREPDPADLIPRSFGASAPGAGRVVAQGGPSGSDFAIASDPAPAEQRRSILRL
jgi:hypothetical protein